ncbi:hypothetical protein U9M48_011045 [Paspalum notatum var. saurae]|uniref:Serpin domain-containing protein n=1 Tax=Paspalum notatum var. saurae TaxID=547442 RepID=A0AAQ3SUL7_PASNO
MAAAAAGEAVRRLAWSGPTELCNGLMKHLARGAGAGNNLVFSPLSIYSSLSAMAAGARGRTFIELLRVVGPRWPGQEGEGPLDDDTRGALEIALAGGKMGDLRLSCVSAVCHHATRTPKLDYLTTAAAWGSVACAVDFTKPEQATKQINSCISNRTGHGIESILDQAEAAVLLDPTRLMLADAFYLKGSLERSFTSCCKCAAAGPSSSYRPFHLLDGSTVHAEFMSSHGEQFVEAYDGFKVLKMLYAARDPYHGVPAKTMAVAVIMNYLAPHPHYSMYIVLPDARDGLWELHHKMASHPCFLYDHQPMCSVAAGEVRVPKLKLSFSTSVKRALQDDLGIETLFSAGAALLPDVQQQQQQQQQEPLYLSDILHKAVLQMDEEFQGSPTVSQTKWDVPAAACVDFVADHPFAFFVVEEVTGAILLAGHVLDPTTTTTQ